MMLMPTWATALTLNDAASMGETLKVLGDSFSTKRGAESRSSDVTRRRSCGGNWDAIPGHVVSAKNAGSWIR